MSGINSVSGPSTGFSLEPKTGVKGNSQGPSFMDALRDTYAKETGKLVGTNLPGDKGTIYSANPRQLLSFHSTVV